MAEETINADSHGYDHCKRAPSGNVMGAAPRFKKGLVTLPNTVDDGDTFSFNAHERFGINRVLAVRGWAHTTEDSVIVEEDPTVVLDGPEVTLTVGGSTDNLKRVYSVIGL